MNKREFLKSSMSLTLGALFFPKLLLSGKNSGENQLHNNSTSLTNDGIFGIPLIKTIDANNIFIQTYSFNVNGSFFKGLSKNLFILCHDLILNENIEIIEGRNIHITCVNLIANRDISIVAKGTDGESAAKEFNAQKTGENGADGDNIISLSNPYKISGGQGGNITINYSCLNSDYKIIISSLGGSGGKGEDGGDGYMGERGDIGGDAPSGGIPEKGKNGKNGGKGGNGAIGGNGGDGGNLKLNRFVIKQPEDPLNCVQDSSFIVSAVGGLAGAGGNGGQGGDGGPGGIGGREGDWNFRGRNSDRQYWELGNRRADVGKQGLKGNNGSKGVSGSAGKNGSILRRKITINELSADLTIPYLKLLMLKAESLYINNHAAESVRLLMLVSQVNIELLDNPVNNLYVSLSKFSFNDKDEITQLVQKANNYLMRIELSLDYWGKSLNYVPRIRKDYLKNEISALIPMAISFEQMVNHFYGKEILNTQDLENIKEVQQSNQNSLLRLNSEFAQKKQFTFFILQNQIKELNEDIERRIQILEKADKKFKDAIKAQNKKKCGFTEVISAVQVIVSIGTAASGLGAGLMSSVNAIKTFNELNETTENTLNGKWGVVKEVQKIVKEASNSYQTATKALDSVEENYSKIFAKQKVDNAETTKLIELELQDFEKLMDRYINMPEARAYKAEMRQYVNAVNIRNQKRLDYTNNVLELDKIRIEIDLLKVQQQKLLTKEFITASTQAPGELQLLILNQYYATRGQIIRLIYLLEKSYEYYSLKSNKMSFLDLSIASLQANIIDGRLRDIENTNALGNGLNLYPDTARVTLTKENYPLIFTTLKDESENYSFDFYISPDDEGFKGEYSDIRIKNVRVFMDKVVCATDKLSMKLTHMGNSMIMDAEGKTFQFMHDKVGLTLDYFFQRPKQLAYNGVSYIDNITGSFEDSKDEYSLISPFANWKLTIRKDANPGLKLNKVKRIDIEFDFYARPRA
ncbi:MAG: hypothetical protein LBE92_07255 [Chryseobacterium sp.]|jgi:hypothetical protein|uniref:hypothetical protein n=1 Tax=Chryseobacterium sp. TaxID=1871047 RepID=UPI00281EECB5|nr:hypothetical protein [Chryseobacterium sp.]MDR2235905.1 hypothetical protein [Chryseobacterium sp.]